MKSFIIWSIIYYYRVKTGGVIRMGEEKIEKKAGIAMPSIELADQIAFIGVLGHKDLGSSCAFDCCLKRTGMLDIMYFSVSREAAYKRENPSYN